MSSLLTLSNPPAIVSAKADIQKGVPETKYDTFAGYRFRNHYYLIEALHPNADEKMIWEDRIIPEGMMRLAIIGDSALRFILWRQWYRDSEQTRNEATRGWFDDMTSNKNLRKIAEHYDLMHCWYLRPGQIPEKQALDKLAGAVEALLGAVYMDSNDLNEVEKVMSTLGLECPAEAKELAAAT